MEWILSSDKKDLYYEDDLWVIYRHQNRGYDPYYTLFKKKLNWLRKEVKVLEKWGGLKPIMKFVDNWNNWKD